jgi:multicomponent Na+:H+ antiporter subunit D
VSLVVLFSLPGLMALGLWLAQPSARVSRAISLAAAGALAAIAVHVIATAADGEVLVHVFGGWRPPFGIAFAADRLSAIFIALHALLLGLCLLALRPEVHGEAVVQRAHPLLFALSFGLFGSFLTADLFNLFVMFELVLITSYLLLQVPGTRRSLAGTLPTLVVNLLASTLFLAGLGILYALGGSVSVAELPRELAQAPETLRRVALTLLVLAFATKAALVPLCFWMPATYPTLSAPIAALFAGIMTKLGAYALLRILPLLVLDPWIVQALLWAGGLSALLGVLAALSQYEVRRLLSFHSVSQLGYLVFALALATPAGVAAAIFFAVHHSLVKSTLYLVADEIERRNDSRDLRRMDFRTATGVPLASCFIIAAFSLSGLPPLSGFVGKLGVFAAAYASEAWAGLTLLVLASVFTLASMLKIWRLAFQPSPSDALPPHSPRSPHSGALPLVAALLLILALGFGAGPVYEYSAAAADALLDGGGYRDAVLLADGRPPLPSEGL